MACQAYMKVFNVKWQISSQTDVLDYILSKGKGLVALKRARQTEKKNGPKPALYSQSSKTNELIFNTVLYDSVCLKGLDG